MAADPYTQVYDALWAMLEASAEFVAQVKEGNRIKFVGDGRSPVKDAAMDADYPEVRIVSINDFPHLLRTSNSSTVVKTFEIQVATADRRLDNRLFPLEWAIFVAMLNWPTTLGALLWGGNSYAKIMRFNEGETGMIEDPDRGIAGWSTVWSCSVEMWFTSGAI